MNRETRGFIWGLVLLCQGTILLDYGINRISTSQLPWLGVFQLFFGIAIVLEGYKTVKKTIE